MSEPVRIEPERLLAQTAWVRRLALSLSRDEASADDLAQEALAAALRKPPPDAASEGALRAWFAAVLRNLAVHRARGESRRSRRERAAARPELERSQERLRELEELRGELVRHVLALPGHEQQVVLLSFFEELDSAEIARRLEVPDSTVRNRLRRALAELRLRLEREHGAGWRQLCLFVLPSTGAKVAAGTGAAAAAGGLWIAGGGAVVLALALLIAWQHWKPGTLEPANSAALAAIPATVESKPEAPPGPEHAVAGSERTPQPVAANTKPFLLFGRVLDAQQKPVKSASVSLIDDRYESFESRGSPDGWYSFPALEPGLFELRIEDDEGTMLRSELDLSAASGELRRDFTLDTVSYVQVRLLKSDGSGWPTREYAHGFEREHELCVVATATAPGKMLEPRTWGDYSVYGAGRYRSPASWGRGISHLREGSSGVLEIFGPRPVFASLCQAERILETKLVDANTDSLEFTLSEEFVRALAANAVAHVVDERSGAPAAGIQVELHPFWTTAGTTKSDADGQVQFRELASGDLELALGAIWRSARIEPGKEHDLGTLPWLPVRRLRAHILDPAGEPAVADVHTTLDDPGLDPAWCAELIWYQSDAAGKFSFPDGPGFATAIIATRKTPRVEAGIGRLPRGEGQIAEVRLRPARLVGLRLQHEAGGRREVRVIDAQGMTWAESALGTLVLPDGEYRFIVMQGGRKLYETKATIDEHTRRIDLKY